jgi:hypothetical protein
LALGNEPINLHFGGGGLGLYRKPKIHPQACTPLPAPVGGGASPQTVSAVAIIEKIAGVKLCQEDFQAEFDAGLKLFALFELDHPTVLGEDHEDGVHGQHTLVGTNTWQFTPTDISKDAKGKSIVVYVAVFTS